jgi:hypothetical protein
LSFPYLYFVVSYSGSGGAYIYNGIYQTGLAVYQSNTPISSWDDKVNPCVTDLYRHGQVCTDHRFDRKEFRSVKELVEFVITLWWQTIHDVADDDLKFMRESTPETAIARKWNAGDSCTLQEAVGWDYYATTHLGIQLQLPKDAKLIEEDYEGYLK